MATPRMPSALDGFIPQATGLAVAFVRKPGEFKLYEYIQIVKADALVIVYAYLDPDEPVRVVSDAEFAWPWGQPRPKPQNNIGNFKFQEVRLNRRAYGYSLAEEIINPPAGGYNPQRFHNAMMLSKAMTNATQRVTTLLETAANWGNNTATANTLNGGAGYWSLASNDETNVHFLAIKKSLMKAVLQIFKSTNSCVKFKDLRLRISPDLAVAMAETSEIHTYIEKSPFAQAELRGDSPDPNVAWGLPSKLYGLPLIVEDSTIDIVRANASGTPDTLDTEKKLIADKTKAVITSVVGGLDGEYGTESFSTVQRYYHKYDLTVESRLDSWNHLYESFVVDQYKENLTAPVSGYLITECQPA